MRARFVEATFFREVKFSEWANFSEAKFDFVVFDEAQFAGESVFFRAAFAGYAGFSEIRFLRAAFDDAEFTGLTEPHLPKKFHKKSNHG